MSKPTLQSWDIKSWLWHTLYGGILSTKAIEGLSKKEREAQGHLGGVVAMLFPHVLHNHVRIISSYPFSVFAAFDDRSMSLAKQKRMAKNAGIEQLLGPMNCGHSPFLSHPEEVSNFIRKVAGEISS
ncbi:hypothetical protein GX50_00519 [[Emmonsia] crescens]|uniref:AB hydrolase-1 domain-containing protein n=1 Tax=[Emmonsia] crescens TaxID=73230 RepID=A0A2B7ZV76_9EURO|nr:hypothetical protein GX50_00519 [Emmonsia crescens]